MAGNPGGMRDPALSSSLTEAQQRDIQKRARRNNQLRVNDRERLRQSLKAEHYIKTVHKAADTLFREHETLSNASVGALKCAIDTHLKLLNKVLPDLKAIELTGEAGEPLSPARIPTGELIRLVMQSHQIEEPQEKVIEAEVVKEPAPVAFAPARRAPPWE